MVLTLGPLVAEAGLLKEAARGAVEERGRNLLALRVLRIALHHATARLRDEVEGTTVEDQGRVSFALANETLLPGAANLALGPVDPRMEPRAPAAAEPHAVVLLSEMGEGIPRRGIKRPYRILAHAPSV